MRYCIGIAVTRDFSTWWEGRDETNEPDRYAEMDAAKALIDVPVMQNVALMPGRGPAP